MSDEHGEEMDNDELESDELENEEVEYEEVEEEISSAEVDRVLETLSDLMEKIDSETIHEYLEEAYNQVFALIYEDEESAEGEDDDYKDEGEVDELEEEELDDFDDTAEAA